MFIQFTRFTQFKFLVPLSYAIMSPITILKMQAEGDQKMPDTDVKMKDGGNLAALIAKMEGEPIASFFKIKVLELSPGYSRVSMKMLPEYLNFNGVIFGSIMMAIADYAFSLAINSLSMPSLATQFNIYLLAPAAVGDELVAEGRVLRSGKRVGVSEMTVTNQNGKLLAKATGTTIPASQT
jgi:acyl-CoA thioesterase